MQNLAKGNKLPENLRNPYYLYSIDTYLEIHMPTGLTQLQRSAPRGRKGKTRTFWLSSSLCSFLKNSDTPFLHENSFPNNQPHLELLNHRNYPRVLKTYHKQTTKKEPCQYCFISKITMRLFLIAIRSMTAEGE